MVLFRFSLLCFLFVMSLEFAHASSPKRLFPVVLAITLVVGAILVELGLELLSSLCLLVFCVTVLFLFILTLSLEGHHKVTTSKPNDVKFFLATALSFGLVWFGVSSLNPRGACSEFFSTGVLGWFDVLRATTLPMSSMLSLVHFLLTRTFCAELVLLNVLILLLLVTSVAYLSHITKSNLSPIPTKVATPHNSKKF